jgi:hypothetical protein
MDGTGEIHDGLWRRLGRDTLRFYLLRSRFLEDDSPGAQSELATQVDSRVDQQSQR